MAEKKSLDTGCDPQNVAEESRPRTTEGSKSSPKTEPNAEACVKAKIEESDATPKKKVYYTRAKRQNLKGILKKDSANQAKKKVSFQDIPE